MFDKVVYILERAVSVFPRFKIVKGNELGVHLRSGEPIRKLDSGLWWFWPLIDDIETVTSCLQVVDLPVQFIENKIGETWGIDGAVIYEIDDPYKAIYAVMDYDETIKFSCMNAITKYVSSTERPSPEELGEFLQGEIEDMADVMGIRVVSVALASISKAVRIYTGA
jgi:regulator of protease activity HflC (stomatin/prohibitin superfamily)